MVTIMICRKVGDKIKAKKKEGLNDVVGKILPYDAGNDTKLHIKSIFIKKS